MNYSTTLTASTIRSSTPTRTSTSRRICGRIACPPSGRRAPKVLHTEDGDVWSFDEGRDKWPVGLTATAGLSFSQFSPMLAGGYREMRPASFDPGSLRSASRGGEHIAFGFGRHYCAGSRLALLEAEVGLQMLFERLANLRIDSSAERPKMCGFAFRSPTLLPVAFDE